MAISLVASTGTAGGATTVTTSAINTTGATLIVVQISEYSVGASIALTDSQGNTWTALTVKNQGNSRSQLHYCVSPSTSASHTFTYGTALRYPSICVQAFSGVSTSSPFDVQNTNGASAATTVTTGSVTPSQNDEVLITGLCFETTGTISINSSFTISNQVNYAFGNNFGSAMAYKIQTTAGAENPTWSKTGTGTSFATGIATFKATASATNTTNFFNLMQE